MVRTIYVVYTDQKLGYAQTRSMKQCTGSDFDIDKQRNNMEEKRNISVTLEEARK